MLLVSSTLALAFFSLASAGPLALTVRENDSPHRMPLCDGQDIDRLSASEAQKLFKSGKLTVSLDF